MDLQVFRTGDRDYGRHIKALICGDPGAGKTLTASTFPNPFYASAEGGLMSIADRGIPFTKITASEQLQTLRMVLEQPPDVRAKLVGQALGYDHPIPVDTIVLDTVDEIARILIRERLESTKHEALQLQDYGWLGEQLRGLLRGMRNLDMHVVFTCHVKETQDSESGRVYFKPAIPGAVGEEIAGYVDLALILTARPAVRVVDQQSQRYLVRTLQTFPDANHPWVKDRSGKLPMEFEVNFTDDFDRISQLIYGGIPETDSEISMGTDAEVPVDREQEQAVARVMDAFPGSEVVTEEDLEGPEVRFLEGDEGKIAETDTPLSREEKRKAREAAKAEAAAAEEEKQKGSLFAEPQEETLKAEEDRSNVNPTTGEISSYTCSDCSSEFTDEDVRDMSMIKYRRVLCMPCMKEAANKKGKK